MSSLKWSSFLHHCLIFNFNLKNKSVNLLDIENQGNMSIYSSSIKHLNQREMKKSKNHQQPTTATTTTTTTTMTTNNQQQQQQQQQQQHHHHHHQHHQQKTQVLTKSLAGLDHKFLAPRTFNCGKRRLQVTQEYYRPRIFTVWGCWRNNISHRIHGTIVHLPTWRVDFSGMNEFI